MSDRAVLSCLPPAQETLARLTQFRRFYLIIVGYIYFTRIVVYICIVTLPYRHAWLASFFQETATLALFVWTGECASRTCAVFRSVV
jgi:hypothetical protein